jgi:vancomycin permeability regulator SanA
MRLSSPASLWRGRGIWLGLALVLVLGADLLWIGVGFPRAGRDRVYTSSALPAVHLPVLILGAGVLPDREPTQVLQSRLDTGLELFRQGKGSWFLVSGDNRALNYNEPKAMRKWLVRRDVPPELVISDYAGRRTYDSLRRAQAVFGLQRMIIVTSDFHLARALYLARRLGLDAYGVPAPSEAQPLRRRLYLYGREYVARHLATWDAWFPPHTLLGPRERTPDDGPEPGREATPGPEAPPLNPPPAS